MMEIRREIELAVPRAEVWEALTDPERLEDWFANEVELDVTAGGSGRFRWANGEERTAVVERVDPEERLVLRWDDDGSVDLRLEDTDVGTRVVVRETSPEWSTALALHALAACAAV
jgi:uncharacterized protein YndB with AHSA1/START domain